MIKYLLCSAVLIAALCSVSFAGSTLTTVPPPAGYTSLVFNGVNDLGDAVGVASVSKSYGRSTITTTTAVLYHAGVLTDLGLGVNSGALDINNAGQIAGSTPKGAFIRQPDGTTTFLSGINILYALNSLGHVSGYNYNPYTGIKQGFIYDGVVHYVGGYESYVYGLNDSDVGVGFYRDATRAGAAKFTVGGPVQLLLEQYQEYSVADKALTINNDGESAGFIRWDYYCRNYPFVAGTGITFLFNSPGCPSAITKITNGHRVFGQINNTFGEWMEGVFAPLSGSVRSLKDVNEGGQAVGSVLVGTVLNGYITD